MPDGGADLPVSALRGIAAIAPDDVWAVGRMRKEGEWMTLIEHWDGKVWSVVPSGSQATS